MVGFKKRLDTMSLKVSKRLCNEVNKCFNCYKDVGYPFLHCAMCTISVI